MHALCRLSVHVVPPLELGSLCMLDWLIPALLPASNGTRSPLSDCWKGLMEVAGSTAAPKLLAQHISSSTPVEGGFRLASLPVFDRVWCQASRKPLPLPPPRRLAPTLLPLHLLNLPSHLRCYSQKLCVQGTVLQKVAGALTLDDGTGTVSVVAPASAASAAGTPGLELGSVQPGDYVLVVGKLLARQQGSRLQLHVKAHKVGARVHAAQGGVDLHCR